MQERKGILWCFYWTKNRYFADFRPFLAISQKKNVMKAAYFQLKTVYT